MAAADGLSDALAEIASGLRIPGLVLALLALLVCALEAGRFLTEYWVRMRAGRGALRTLVAGVLRSPEQAGALSRRAPSALSTQALKRIGDATAGREPDAIEQALADYELAVQRRLDRTRILVRAGPALGLMGTLIPLAPGLAALGHGDVATLASDLRTAFAATTIGLLVGTVAFAITLVRTRMYSEDLTELERAGAQTPPPADASARAPLPLPGHDSTEPPQPAAPSTGMSSTQSLPAEPRT